MANFRRSSRPTKRDYFGFSFITVLCIISIQVLLCSARPNPDRDDSIEKSDNAGVSKSLKELPLIEEEEDKPERGQNDGDQDEQEEIEEDYDDEDTGDTNQTPKKYSEPRETSSTSSTIAPEITHSIVKTENEHTDEDKNADESQTKSTTMIVELSSNVIGEEDTTTSNGLIQKNYFFILFIPVFSYFLI